MQGGGGKRGYDAEERRRGRKKNTGKTFLFQANHVEIDWIWLQP